MTTSRLQIHTPNGHDKQPSARALTAVSEAAVAAAGSTGKVVKAHPLTSVGIALGGGILLGVFAARALAHKTTLAEAFQDQLGIKRRIARAIQSWL